MFVSAKAGMPFAGPAHTRDTCPNCTRSRTHVRTHASGFIYSFKFVSIMATINDPHACACADDDDEPKRTLTPCRLVLQTFNDNARSRTQTHTHTLSGA